MAAVASVASGPARAGASVILGAVAALFIFGGMRYLILSEGKEPEAKPDAPNIEITASRDDTRVITRNDRPDQPDEIKAPPPPPRIEAAKSEQPDEGLASILGALPGINPDAVDSGSIAFVVSDRDAQPLVRIPPQYPVRAAERGLEGSCDMTFNVLPDGTVDGTSIQARCTSSMFARDATRAVERWKYQPKIQNGEAVPRYGVATTLDFTLTDG